MRLAVIGVPTNSSGGRDGVARAPAVLREIGLIELIGQICDVVDYGDLKLPKAKKTRSKRSGIIAEEALVEMIRLVRSAVGHAIAEGRFPLVLGGDCPILLGCLGGAAAGGLSPGLIFVDGHEDAYPPALSPTGEAADMELGFLVDPDPYLPPALSQEIGIIEADDVVILGARDRAILERESVRSLAHTIETYSDEDLLGADLKDTARRAAARLLDGRDGLWLHVDLDVLSTNALPAVDYQQAGGLGWEDLKALTEAVFACGRVIGWDMTIYNPDLDPGYLSGRRIAEYIAHAVASLFARHV